MRSESTVRTRAGTPGDAAQDSRRLLKIAEEILQQLHPGRHLVPAMESDLTVDLGLDSLGRAELFARVQAGFKVDLPESLLTEAQTLADLWQALARGDAAAQYDAREQLAAPSPVVRGDARPENARTLVELLERRATLHPDRVHLLLHEASGAEHPLTYRELWTGALAVAASLRARGVAPNEPVAIMLTTTLDYFIAFFGVLAAGAVAVPLYPPASRAQLEEHMRRQRGILENCRAAVLITMVEAKPLARLLRAQVASLREVVGVEELRDHSGPVPRPQRRPADLALLQYTSGSTGAPKGVMLSHAMLLTNIRLMGEAIAASSEDVFVSWLPLYHDMGLIGAWLGSLYFACTFVVMSPLSFLSRPSRWLWAIHRHRGTLSASPNFGYALCAQRIPAAELEGLDLSSWRLAFNGAEPVVAETLEAFAQRYRPYGFGQGALAPVYGLAEAALGVAFTAPGRGARVDRISRDALTQRQRAEPVAEADDDALRIVSNGRPLSGYAVRIVDTQGRSLGERDLGRLQLRGPSCTNGYYRNAEATAALFDGEWLETGDLGYLADGELYLTGRAKEVIIRAGRNLYPYQLEETIGALEGARQGRVAVFGAQDPRLATERLVVVVETRLRDDRRRAALRQAIVDTVSRATEIPPDDVLLTRPGTVLKTSSGKIRRASLRALYENGQLGRGVAAPMWLQLTRLSAQTVPAVVRRATTGARHRLWGGYAGLMAVLFALLTAMGVLLLPRRRDRRWLARGVARALLRVTGIPLRVIGEWPGSGSCVVVANHASYLDAVVLSAVIPARAAFVAKRELGDVVLIGGFLRRLGTFFVERFNPRAGAEDAEALAHIAGQGQSLVFFAEGGFQRAPGLLPFRLGAFVVASRNRLPVIPIGLRGTRTLLPDGVWWPRRSALEVHIGEPVLASGTGWKDAVCLREATRAAVLNLSNEIDLDGH